jgi:hypothetical protein
MSGGAKAAKNPKRFNKSGRNAMPVFATLD